MSDSASFEAELLLLVGKYKMHENSGIPPLAIVDYIMDCLDALAGLLIAIQEQEDEQ